MSNNTKSVRTRISVSCQGCSSDVAVDAPVVVVDKFVKLDLGVELDFDIDGGSAGGGAVLRPLLLLFSKRECKVRVVSHKLTLRKRCLPSCSKTNTLVA